MRVALVCPYSWSVPGGVQAHVAGLACRVRALGAHVDVIAPADAPASFPGLRPVGGTIPIPDNGSLVRVALGPLAAERTARAVRAGDYDIVHVHEPMIPAVSLTALLAAEAPLVATFHMYSPTARWYRPFGPLCRRALARLDARVAVSAAARRHVERVVPGRYRIVPNAIDVGAHEPSEPLRREGIAFVGRPDARKGLPVLLEAFHRLPGAPRLDLVGPDDDAVAALTARLDRGVRARIIAHGRVDEAARIRVLHEAAVLCAPSLVAESFGIVLVEGMAAGAAVVASAIPGYVDVVRAGCGLLVRPGDSDALARVLAGVLADDVLRSRLAATAAREGRRYDWSRVVGEIVAVYEDVLARGRGLSRGSGARAA